MAIRVHMSGPATVAVEAWPSQTTPDIPGANPEHVPPDGVFRYLANHALREMPSMNPVAARVTLPAVMDPLFPAGVVNFDANG